VVAREVVAVQDVGQHQRVDVGAVRRQEDQRVAAVEVAQALQALGVLVHAPRPAMQRTHERAERVDRRRALDRGQLLQIGGQLGKDVVGGALQLVGELLRTVAQARRRGDLLGDQPRDLVAIAQQLALDAVHRERRAACDERRERVAAAATDLTLEVAQQLVRARRLTGADAHAAGDTPRDQALQRARRAARADERAQVAVGSPTRSRRRRRGAGRAWSPENTGKPLGAHAVRGDPADGRPDPLLRRRRPGARGQGRPASTWPTTRRSIRREPIGVCRPGHAVELPADDGGLEDRPGAGRRQHGRAQAVGHHAASTTAAGRDRAGVPAAGRAQRRLRRPRHRARARRAPDPQMVSITGSVRAGMEVAAGGRGRPQAVHLELGGKAPVIVFDDADIEAAAEAIAGRRLLQRRPGLHRRHPRARRPGVHDDFVAALTEQAKGTDRHARRRGRALRPAEQRQPADHVSGLGRPRCPTTPTGWTTGGDRQGDAGYFYEPTVCPACSRTTS
jgi:hypothetical protein